MQRRSMCLRRIGVVLAAAAAVGGQAAAAQTATYEVTFQGNWTTASTPGGVVGGAHFTTLIGAVHGSEVTFWASGQPASRGVEDVPELGSVGRFRGEVQASPHTRSVIQESVSGGRHRQRDIHHHGRADAPASHTAVDDRPEPRLVRRRVGGVAPRRFGSMA